MTSSCEGTPGLLPGRKERLWEAIENQNIFLKKEILVKKSSSRCTFQRI